MIKLIISDLDGTLADNKGQIPEEAFTVIEDLEKKNIHFAVATGRQCATVENDFKSVLDKIYVIADNGALIKHKGKCVGVTYLEQEKAREVIEEVKRLENIEMIISCEDTAYKITKDKAFHEEVSKYYYSLSYVQDQSLIEASIIKLALYNKDGITKEFETWLREKWGEDFSITVSGRNWVDIGSLYTSKGMAVKMLKEQLIIEKENCMAFGDYFNDVSMLAEAEESYVMEHAPEEMKAYGKYSLDEGSVLKVIKERCL
ncbi:HAD family hydrolase [Zhenhengia yiwuensis]|uniref:HAD family phosphatase n=1 Tax=Zhenhengia yiwuensis TaxID=2763666 RepID=A0A926EJL5_9FIRM|nr:HAD family hydrolase [Zhenhengia yiwuensis]MBC8580784.1 HAD family phosphatase [Zhenhengia yiwuensis]